MKSIKKLLIWGVSLTIIPPILGLAGTVIGMVNSFSASAQSSGSQNAEALAQNIFFALYATVAGLFFSLIGIVLLIICLVKYLNNKQKTATNRA